MPNIEMHGFMTDKSDEVRKQIVAAVKPGFSNPEAVVVTQVWSVVKSLDGRPEPFLRIVAQAGSGTQLAELKKLLKPLGYGIEIMPITEWVPPKEAEEAT